MSDWPILLATSWVLFCLAALVLAPAVVFAVPGGTGAPRNADGVLAWTWLIVALGAPAAAAANAFNWVTALLLAGLGPAILWLFRHRGAVGRTARTQLRSIAFQAIAPGRHWRPSRVVWAPFALALLPAAAWAGGGTDLRLPVPGDFDTLAGARDLLNGTPALDPLASMTSLMTRVSMTDPLIVMKGLRLALAALAALSLCALVTATGAHWACGAVAASAGMALVPWWPTSTWLVVLAASIALTAAVRAARHSTSLPLVDAGAAVALLGIQLGGPATLLAASAEPVFLEHASAARETLRILRSPASDRSLIVAPAEPQVEFAIRGRFHDLAAFVSRFHGQTADPRFRFDLPARRLFVFVELQPLDVSRPAPHVRFVAAQPAVYRVPRERARLARLARTLCDDYRRTHASAEIVHDDGTLRIYRFDL
jgi:hypothetical protein